nr:hypothetical protein Iba_chr09dCG15900 [Ipomoea batatas]
MKQFQKFLKSKAKASRSIDQYPIEEKDEESSKKDKIQSEEMKEIRKESIHRPKIHPEESSSSSEESSSSPTSDDKVSTSLTAIVSARYGSREQHRCPL